MKPELFPAGYREPQLHCSQGRLIALLLLAATLLVGMSVCQQINSRHGLAPAEHEQQELVQRRVCWQKQM